METKLMSERDGMLLRMRPEIPWESIGVSPLEAFQYKTLRPILKFQNSILLAQFRMYITKFKPIFNAYTKPVQLNFVEDAMKKDSRIRNSLIACTVGMMTLEEYDFYCTNKNEANKRIVTLIIRRVQSQIEVLY